jgi:hypothetical protein
VRRSLLPTVSSITAIIAAAAVHKRWIGQPDATEEPRSGVRLKRMNALITPRLATDEITYERLPPSDI